MAPCVESAPTPASVQGQSAPTPKTRVATARPNKPVSGLPPSYQASVCFRQAAITKRLLRKFNVRRQGFDVFNAEILKQSYKAGQIAVARIDGGQRYGRELPLGHDFNQATILEARTA